MELSENSFERLNKLKEMAEAPSYTEVMKDALRLYEYILEKDADGSTFHVKSKSGALSQIKVFA